MGDRGLTFLSQQYFALGLEVKGAVGISHIRPHVGNQLFGRAQLLALS